MGRSFEESALDSLKRIHVDVSDCIRALQNNSEVATNELFRAYIIKANKIIRDSEKIQLDISAHIPFSMHQENSAEIPQNITFTVSNHIVMTPESYLEKVNIVEIQS